MTATSLDTIAEKARKAADAYQAAQDAQDAAERQAAEERQARALAWEQAFLDAYDPAALRRAVVESYAACVAAVAGGNLPAAVAAHVAAVIAEHRHGQRAVDAVARGAVPRPELVTQAGLIRGAGDHYRDRHNSAVMSTSGDVLADLAADAHTWAIRDAGQQAARADDQRLDDDRTAAIDGARS